jgi:hypothetical protein
VPSHSLVGPAQVNFQQANGSQDPVALIIPINSGDLQSFQQQVYPFSLPMMSGPTTGAPGYVLNMPAPMGFAGPSQPFFAMAPGSNPGQAAQTQLANQLLNALVAPTAPQPQLPHLPLHMQQQQNLQAQQQLVAMQQPQIQLQQWQVQPQPQQQQWQSQPQQLQQQQQAQFDAQVNTAIASQQLAAQLVSLLGLTSHSQVQVNAQQQQPQQQQAQGPSGQWPQPPPS